MFRKRRKGDLAPLSRLLTGAYPSNEPEELKAIRVFGWWDKAVPPRVAKNARPVRLWEGVLTVHTTTAAWASDLDFLRPQLLESVRRHAPNAKVREIRIRVGKLPDLPVRPPPEEPVTVEPIAELPDDLARALAAVGDDSIRDAVAAAAKVALAPRPPKKPRRP